MNILSATRRSIFIFSAIVVVVSCDSGVKSGPDTITINSGSQTAIELPEVLRGVKTLDPETLQLQVRVNDVATSLQRQGDELWSGSINVPTNQTARIFVEWGMNYGTGNNENYLKLAERFKFISIGTQASSVSFDGYNLGFDADNDSLFNLTEINQNRSPFNSLDVTIGENGSYVTGGVEHPFSSECGSQIPIPVQIRGPALDAADDAADELASDEQAWWCAVFRDEMIDADGNLVPIENIQITVNVKDTDVIQDSGSTWYDDDSVELFIDGNNNKGGAYDGVNDYQFQFSAFSGDYALVKGPAQPVNLGAGFSYYNGGYVLTAQIPIAEVGIVNGQPFGLNVEVNDDDDGGLRDRKFSWVATQGLDLSFRNTAAFGTSQVPRRN